MNITNTVASEVTSVDFNVLLQEDILAVSVKQIVNPLTFASVLPGKIPIPINGGLYDPALGASDTLRQRYVFQ
jgi:DNA-directed RNA polymerase I subunit RPA1